MAPTASLSVFLIEELIVESLRIEGVFCCMVYEVETEFGLHR